MPEIQQLQQRIEKLERLIFALAFSDRYIFSRDIEMQDGRNIQLATGTGTKIGTGTGERIGFFNATPVVRVTLGANLTNNVTSGGDNNTIANYTDLNTYANDAGAIRNDIYQLARSMKLIQDGVRSLGLFS